MELIFGTMELIFEVREPRRADFSRGHSDMRFSRQAETWEELRANVLEATLYFEDSQPGRG